jgi:hypothetical protein
MNPNEKVADVHFTKDEISVALMDGRTISAPLAWYPRLLHATAKQRKNWRTCVGPVMVFTGLTSTRI